ncbi:L-arabinose isomerase [Alicyclobacillus shizuokensis]|uniref:L-arabinose isomerase n=1 Tax=Alicyclobacillus shizuokensis TaxID=392014 RepID=UPI00082A1C23|nr:L-arabinose isomerase [Alicyclobacillus shizuokensis]
MRKPTLQFWFVTGSQHLYGEEALRQVEAHTTEMVRALNAGGRLPFALVQKPVVATAEAIHALFLEANRDPTCAGVVTWMHTFSPAKMWIAGLMSCQRPILHLHTQFNRDIPWPSIDMDFMNLNQSAHGDREYGFMAARLKVARKVVVGHFADEAVQSRIAAWMRVAAAHRLSQGLKVARFGDNMRDVAVTEGDKVEAQIRFGWTVDGYGIGDLVDVINQVGGAEVDRLLGEYRDLYEIPAWVADDAEKWQRVREQAQIELGLRRFLDEGVYEAFTTTFEDLHGMTQLPGLAAQRLMADGYGFGGEGDWKTAALLRVFKVMADLKGTSFMEDYTYHLEPGNQLLLGAHMLEVCPTVAADKPRLEVHPLLMGHKADPARLVFNGRPGRAVVVSVVDLGHRFRIVQNEVEAVPVPKDMPKLPVARVLWRPEPSLSAAAEAWIYAGGAHHTVFSYEVTAEQVQDFADILGVECVTIDQHTNPQELRTRLRLDDAAWKLV